MPTRLDSFDTTMRAADRCASSDDFSPIRMLEIELGEPLSEIEPQLAGGGARYEQALVLARLHRQPLGLVEVDLPDGELRSEDLASRLWSMLAPRINAHLRRDGLEPVERLTPTGLRAVRPLCERERESFLKEAPFVSVIVPTRDRPERLLQALESILACDYPLDRYEIVVVDNAPATDATVRLVRERFSGRGSRVRYLREDAPGSASARNHGLRETQGELVAFTDDDVRVDRDWLTELARAFDAVPDVACVSGLLVPMELETAPQLWFEEYGGFSQGFDRRVYDLTENRPHDDPLYPYAAGRFGSANNLAYRRSTLLELGGFDPALGNGTPALGGVDFEMLLRTILRGHRILYQPTAVVHHLHRRDLQSLRRQIYAYGAGIAAVMLRTLGADPRLIPDFVFRRLPRGLWFALDPRSGKNANKHQDYPSELTWLELRGLLAGPLLYTRSRRLYGRHEGPLLDTAERRASA